jgi:hypothetical protein
VDPSVAPASAISGLGLHVSFQLADLALKLLDHRPELMLHLAAHQPSTQRTRPLRCHPAATHHATY